MQQRNFLKQMRIFWIVRVQSIEWPTTSSLADRLIYSWLVLSLLSSENHSTTQHQLWKCRADGIVCQPLHQLTKQEVFQVESLKTTRDLAWKPNHQSLYQSTWTLLRLCNF